MFEIKIQLVSHNKFYTEHYIYANRDKWCFFVKMLVWKSQEGYWIVLPFTKFFYFWIFLEVVLITL